MELELRLGRKVTLDRLNQWVTYKGVIEGVPNRRINDGYIKGTVQVAKKLWGGSKALQERGNAATARISGCPSPTRL